MKPTRTLQRGLEVLEVLVAADEPLGPTRVGDLVGLDKATVGRLLYTLCESGYVRQEVNGSYRLTSKLARLSGSIALRPDIREIARRYLIELRDATEETVHLGVLEGDHVVYIDKIDGTHPVRLVSAIGQTMPVNTTALGKAALAWMAPEPRDVVLDRIELVRRTDRSIVDLAGFRAELERTRMRGYSVDDRENEDHAYCVGAPILGDTGEVVAMISLSGPSYRVMDLVEQHGARCRATADAISAELTGRSVSGEAAPSQL